MTDHKGRKFAEPAPTLAEQVGAKASRKIKAQRGSGHVWFGLGMMGLIGWSVVLPTLAGAALGAWLDRSQPGALSWALTLMLAGLTIGCTNAWHWIAKEDKAMRRERGDRDA